MPIRWVGGELGRCSRSGVAGRRSPNGVVDRVSESTPVSRPAFEAGDVLVFDDLFLHRTAVDPEMPRLRHAIETWFFAPSRLPIDATPLLF